MDKKSVSDYAREYISKGFKSIPLDPQKKSLGRKNWQNLNISEEEVPKYFNDDNNIGIILGPSSGNLVDIDLDSEEAVKMAHFFLPETNMKCGRNSRHISHYFYRSEGVEYKKYYDPDKKPRKSKEEPKEKPLLEIRTAGQTMVPPSIHPNGEELEWRD